MATFPGAIASFRTMVNRIGVVYDALKTKVIYAEDFNNERDEIVAIETYLKSQPNVVEITDETYEATLDYGHNILLANVDGGISFPAGYPTPTQAIMDVYDYYAIYQDIYNDYIFVTFINNTNSGLWDYADRIVPSCSVGRAMYKWNGSAWAAITWNDARVIHDGNLFDILVANYNMLCKDCNNDVEDHYPDFPHATYYTGVTAPTNNWPIPATCEISLPSAVDNFAVYTIKSINTAHVLITPYGDETIDGDSSFEIITQNDFITLIAFDGNWYII